MFIIDSIKAFILAIYEFLNNLITRHIDLGGLKARLQLDNIKSFIAELGPELPKILFMVFLVYTFMELIGDNRPKD